MDVSNSCVTRLRALRSNRRFLLLAVVAATATALFTPTALANDQGIRYYSGGITKQGVRSTIWTPNSSEPSIGLGDAMFSSVQTTDNVLNGNMMQIGPLYQDAMGTSFDCQFGNNGLTLKIVTEVQHNGAYSCFDNGSASWSTGYLSSVVEGTDHYWRSYLNGAFTNIRTQWSSTCGNDACQVRAMGEEVSNVYGYWPAKFAGSGSTQWQLWNGSNWSTIGTTDMYVAYLPDQPSSHFSLTGTYPTGIWSFIYSNP